MGAPQGQPVQVWSHRGRVEPGQFGADNTAAGVAAAIAAGADGVEIDAWLCTDGSFVLTHDQDTPNGPVDRCQPAVLGHLARLEEALVAAGEATVNVELKVPPDSSAAEQAHMGEALRDWLGRFIGAGRSPEPGLIVSSFAEAATRSFLAAGLPIRTGHLCNDIPDEAGLEELARSGYWGVHFLAPSASDGDVERIGAAGLAAVAWTVNDPERAAWLVERGVQVIISDVPAVILEATRAP